MIKKSVCAALLGLVAFFGTPCAKAAGSCLFYADLHINSSFTVEVTGSPNGNMVPPINGQNGDWLDVGVISAGDNCTNLTGASFTVGIPVNWIGNNPKPLNCGTITIQCWKYNPDGTATVVSSAPVNLTIDAFSTQCTFQFYVAACDGQGACSVGVCKTCLQSPGGIGQQ